MSKRFEDLVGGIEDPAELDRLRRVHQLLLSVDAPPEVSPALRVPSAAEPATPCGPSAARGRAGRSRL